MTISTRAAKRPAPPGSDLLRIALFSRRARHMWGLLLALLLGFVLYSALSPHPRGPSLGWDKANHVSAFAALAFCGLLALRERPRHLLWIAVGLFAVGAGIEFAQAHVPGRSADPRDLIANAVGILLGLLAGSHLARSLDRRRSRRANAAADRPGCASQTRTGPGCPG
jgi:VanZ family protein